MHIRDQRQLQRNVKIHATTVVEVIEKKPDNSLICFKRFKQVAFNEAQITLKILKKMQLELIKKHDTL